MLISFKRITPNFKKIANSHQLKLKILLKVTKKTTNRLFKVRKLKIIMYNFKLIMITCVSKAKSFFTKINLLKITFKNNIS